ncbi:hypothetical protein L7D48_18520 [Streptomyces sp. S1A]|uniref:hypothetical protein n=1 Tax=Streptomyces sp. ICN903 TaxID=2964654 RepID=UPI001EDAE1CF|nr:hypothetical protein [Streptomyces sp. ICN903]MCG3042541.1 hypothetical protein [Streptomyces sp. ICN903]
MTSTFRREPADGAHPAAGRRSRTRQLLRQPTALACRYQHSSTAVLRVCVGVVFCWFGILKFFPGASAAEGVAVHAMTRMTFGLVPAQASLLMLAVLETAIGLGLITKMMLRYALAAFFLHMAGVFLTLLLLPGDMWHTYGTIPTLEGQYVIKNLVLVAACLHISAEELAP